MKPARSLIVASAMIGALVTTSKADESVFKAYGFADVELLKQDFQSNNSLVMQWVVDPNTQLYLNHLNTYLDWKPNANVRALAEIAYNRDQTQRFAPGMRLHADSVAIYNDIFRQNGSPTTATILQGLSQQPGFSSQPQSVQNHIADSILQTIQAGIAAGTHQAVQGINGMGALSKPSASSKDHGITLPRVQIDLLFQDEINVRVGKFITPSGIWNVDHGSPAILTINQPYETNYFQIFPVSQTGAQLFGHTSAGDHDLSYAGWLTTGRAGTGIANEADYAAEPKNLDDWAVGAHLQSDLAYLDGIRVGGTFHTGTHRGTQYWFSPAVTTTTGGSDLAGSEFTQVDTTYDREICYGLDTKLQWKGFILQAEWNHRKVLNLMADQAETNINAEYVLVGRRFPLNKSFEVTPYVFFETISWKGATNNPVFQLDDFPTNGFATYLGGLNFGIYGNVRLKLEYSYQQVFARALSVGQAANTYSDSDLSFTQYAAQLSVGF